MTVRLAIRNESTRKQLCRRDSLERLASRVCAEEIAHGQEGVLELSLLLCDDAFMAELNKRYRHTQGPTDVLSFEQDRPEGGVETLLGDIIVSLETVERRCGGDRASMRAEVRLLFCHGLLHLLGYDHGTPGEQQEMIAKQARYLGLEPEAAWLTEP